jgi:hypothetical protein
MEVGRAERWAQKTYSELYHAFFLVNMGCDMGCVPTPTSGGWEVGIGITPEQTLSALIGWRLVVERKRMQTLHARLESTDRTQSWTLIESKSFPEETPSGSVPNGAVADWASQVIRSCVREYVKSLRQALERAFRLNGDDARIEDAGLEVVERRTGEDDVIGWTFVIGGLPSFPDRIFIIAITQHDVLLKAVIAYQGQGFIGRKKIVAGTTASQIATWARDAIGSYSGK